jgi:hypothetical protein
MRSGQTQLVSEEVDEEEARLDFGRVANSIHGDVMVRIITFRSV